MVQFDTRLPLLIESPNVLAALDAGTQAAANQASVMRQAEGQNLFRQYGPGAARGDQDALAKLAGYDPGLAQGLDFNRQENARADARLGIAREQLDLARAETARAVREAQDKADAANQVEMMKTAFKAMDVGMRSGDMRAVSQGLRMFGLQDLTPEEGMQVAAQMVAGGVEGLASAYLPKEAPAPTSAMREYELARQQGFTGSFVDYQTALEEAGRSTTTVTLPGQVPGVPADEEALRKKLGEGEGNLWATYLEQGGVSAGTVADMQLLDELIQYAPQGPITGRLAQAFPGVNSAADAFQSVVKRVAPTLRAPGSGSTSDIEYDGMLRSLPQLAARPEANAAIAAMMKAKAQINIERARVVQAFQSNQISVTEARTRLQEIDSRSIMTPELAGILSGLAPSQPTGNTTSSGVTWSIVE